MKVILKKHSGLDFFYGQVFGSQIPTKQDKFKPVKDVDLFIKREEEYLPFDSKRLYEKKEIKPTHKDFEEKLKKNFQQQIKDDSNFPINKPQKVEVVLSIQMTEKRLKQVDVDNLTKSVLDCLTGTILNDDSQIVNILASKNVHPEEPANGFMIGVRKIKDNQEDSWFSHVKLAYFEKIEESEKK